MVEALDLEARRTGRSRSALIRDAVEGYLSESRETAIAAQLATSYREIPQGAEDEWGDLAEQMRDNTRRTLRRLDEEEAGAGLGW